MTPADTLRDVIERLEQGRRVDARLWVALQKIFGTPPGVACRAFESLDLNAIAALEREVLPAGAGVGPTVWPSRSKGSSMVIGTGKAGVIATSSVAGPHAEARARLIALCRAKLAEVGVGDAAS